MPSPHIRILTSLCPNILFLKYFIHELWFPIRYNFQLVFLQLTESLLTEDLVCTYVLQCFYAAKGTQRMVDLTTCTWRTWQGMTETGNVGEYDTINSSMRSFLVTTYRAIFNVEVCVGGAKFTQPKLLLTFKFVKVEPSSPEFTLPNTVT